MIVAYSHSKRPDEKRHCRRQRGQSEPGVQRALRFTWPAVQCGYHPKNHLTLLQPAYEVIESSRNHNGTGGAQRRPAWTAGGEEIVSQQPRLLIWSTLRQEGTHGRFPWHLVHQHLSQGGEKPSQVSYYAVSPGLYSGKVGPATARVADEAGPRPEILRSFGIREAWSLSGVVNPKNGLGERTAGDAGRVAIWRIRHMMNV
jgi:hypothetical protein